MELYHHPGPVRDEKGNLIVEIVGTENGIAKTYFRRLSDNMLFVPGEPEEEFRIVFRNPGAKLIEVVVAVNGVDVASGNPKASCFLQGTIVEPGKKLTLEGWRLDPEDSESGTKPFLFEEPDRSFLDQLENGIGPAGIIGAAMFELQKTTEGLIRMTRASFFTVGYKPYQRLQREHGLLPAEPRAFSELKRGAYSDLCPR